MEILNVILNMFFWHETASMQINVYIECDSKLCYEVQDYESH